MTNLLEKPQFSALAALAALALLAFPAAGFAQETLFGALEEAPMSDEGGVSIQLDNDLFSGSERDQDFSWGATLTVASPQPHRIAAPIERARARIAPLLGSASVPGAYVSRATQLGILAMTPKDLAIGAVQPEDRPYASLVFLSAAEMRVSDVDGRARFTSFTVGALGLAAAETTQKVIHAGLGGELPRGWSHQISEGGEPTARYVHAEQWLVTNTSGRSGTRPEMKLTLSGSAGFLTEGSAAVSMRWGQIRTPWWSFNPELDDYTAAPVAPITGFGRDAVPEIYGFFGARAKVRAYNALLQGQFRHSDVRFGSSDLARVQGEAWAGIASNWSDWRVTYAMHVASPELSPEPAARSLAWASLSVVRAF